MVTTDHYAGVAPGWDAHAGRVYGPIAAQLVAAAPHPLAGRCVLDAGAGTGLASIELATAGARVIALDLSPDMLRWRRSTRPPAVVGRIGTLPLRAGAVDDVVAAFVLNHLDEPVAALRDLARVTRAGGAVLATVFANSSQSTSRDRIDEVAVAHGFRWPDWYRRLKGVAAPQLGTVDSMAESTRAAGLVVVDAVEYAADVGLDVADDLVDYRLGQAHCRAWLDSLPDEGRAAVRAAAIAAVTPVMEPYRPHVVRLVATVA